MTSPDRITSGTVPTVATVDIRALPDFEQRMAAARARAGYELGDPSFADVIVGAFLDPVDDAAALTAEMDS